jgi:hypothetical protein
MIKVSNVLLLLGVSAAACVNRSSSTSAPMATTGSDAIATTSVSPANMARVGTIDERYQSYNVEMLEVTGGKFWKPYAPTLAALSRATNPKAATGGKDTPAGMNPELYEYRPPMDLSQPRLRKLAAALGPAYVRISGTWANTTFFAPSDEAPSTPPPGFKGVLTRAQWKGVIDFAHSVEAKIVTSVATGAGARDGSGVWTPTLARRWFEYTKSVGGEIAAAEFMNEPNLATMGGAPPGYDAFAYGRDFKIFRAFAKQAVPGMLILGPGSVGETEGDWGVAYGDVSVLQTRDLLAAMGAGIDAFSYHHYGATSKRCAGLAPQTSPDAALTEEWLQRTDETLAFYRKLRDQFEPGRPFWNTETADAACGGNPWGGTFLDSFRYLDQLGRLAKQDVRVIMHNTLVASDYGLLDDRTLAPKPNYWSGLLWRKLMGTTVLEAGVLLQRGLHVYAHCLRGVRGGTALLVLNTDRSVARRLVMANASERYTLDAPELQSKTIQLNGALLELAPGDELPPLTGAAVPSGEISFAPATITFLAIPAAQNQTCR